MMQACIITIGDELLQGYTVDTNSAWLGIELQMFGVNVSKKISIADELDEIEKELLHIKGKFDLVFITGGLGPTLDDVTRKAIAKTFDCSEKIDEDYWKVITERFATRGLDIPQNNRSQAIVLIGADIIENPVGTARGIHINDNQSHYFVMPGVPREMKGMFTENIAQNYLPEKSASSIILIRTTGIFESKLAERMETHIHQYEDRYSFSYLPHFIGVDFKIRQDDEDCPEGLKKVAEHFFDLLTPYAYGWGDDILETVIGKQLTSRGLKLSVAESCSGGMLSKRITDVPRSSAFYHGGITAYSNSIKQSQLAIDEKLILEYGAVSEPVAKAMAQNIKNIMNTEIGVSTTGISGPGGGSAGKPVGLVYIAVAWKNEVWVKEFNFFPQRSTHREMTSQAALNMIRKVVHEQY